MVFPGHKPYDDDDVPDDFILPPGDIERGCKIFKKRCAQCHSIHKNGYLRTGSTHVGPNLYGIYGSTAGMGGRSSLHISDNLTTAGILWTDINLMRYMKNPRAFTSSPIYMNFKGIEQWQDRVDLIWYLKKVTEEQLNDKIE